MNIIVYIEYSDPYKRRDITLLIKITLNAPCGDIPRLGNLPPHVVDPGRQKDIILRHADPMLISG